MRRGKGRGQDRKGRSKNDDQFMKLPYGMIRCDAFRSLRGATLKVFLELRSRYNGFNNGSVFLSLREAAETLGMSKTTAGNAFTELEEKGFIRKTKQGLFERSAATEWELTDCKFNGDPPKRSFMPWRK